MCILCVIQKWSRKVATMLPWLVIPLIGLWLLSQFLPPAFRFEITSPRLACVLVLLVTLFWYEVLMPQLSSWRVRRNARIKERKRLEAIEMQKLRKNAVRKCRNCKTPYRDQNPCGGKFNCCYCGHKSKRPEMDQLCMASDLGRFSSSGILKDLVGKVWADNNWICGQDWLENGGNWVNGSFSGKSSYLKKNSGGFFGSGNDYFFSFLLVFVCKSLAAILLGIIWIFVRLFRFSFDDGDTSMESDINGLSKKGENGVNCNETKSEKARRKAEEKRQARLEREQLEEEERKQREEVARLVEERRKLRDENDNKHNKKAFKALPRDNKDKKEAERKRQERKKEWDRGSSRSNSDVDELEKRANKEIEKSKKGEADREHNRSKGSMADSYNKGSVGARYLDRMRGNFFPSSKTLTGGGFFGKGVNANANANASNTREHRSNASLDHSNKKDFVQPERAFGKSNAHADDKNQNRLARFESHPCPPPKRSWHQLFSRSSPTSSSTNINVISRPNGNSQTEAQSSIASGYPVSQGYDIPATQGLPYHLPNYSYGNTTSSIQLSSNVAEHENFEDPCYVPDPVLSVGPVSEPHDSFPVDFGFLGDIGFEKPSPIASPVSRPRSDSSVFPSPQRTQENTNLPMDDHGAAIEKGWQAWNSCRYMPDMSYVGAKTKWNLPQKSSASILKKEDYVLSNTTGLMHTNSDDSWTFRTSYGSISSSNNHLSMNPHEGVTHNELVYEIPNGSAINHQFQPYHSVVWAKKEKVACQVSVEGIETIPTIIGPRGGLYPPLDVQPVWSYE